MSLSAPVAGTSPTSRSPLIALRHRDFRLYWGGQMVSTAGSMMQTAAVAWQVYLLTHSAVALGLIGLVRVGPIVVFSLGGGVVADAIDRRRLLMVTQTALLLTSVGLALLTLSGHISIWLIYLLTAIAAAALAFDSPARQALVPSLVPRAHLPNALSLNGTMFQTASVVGPSLAGVVIATRGVASVYLLDAVSFLAVLAVLFVIRPPRLAAEGRSISLDAAFEGLRFVFRTPILLSTMFLDFVATFFGSAIALLPIFAHDILHVGSQGYGLLYAAPAMGSILAGVTMAFIAGHIIHQGRTIIVAVMIYAVCTTLCGLSHVFLLSLFFLAGTGAADTVSMILRQTVRQIVTPDELRGRMTSVSMVFFMGGPQLGEFEAGMLARALGASFSVISGGIAALLATGVIAVYGARLRQYKRQS
ncbi:MAG: MFS transporter [Chloroflexota bacterium]